MSVGKKLAVVSSVVVTGVSGALFFSKDDSPLRFWRSSSDDPFAQQVERRVGGQATWTPGSTPGAGMGLATAAIPQFGDAPLIPETRSRTLDSVGSLLPPIEGVPEEEELSPVGSMPPPREYQTAPMAADPYSSPGERTHRVADGDTLSRLAVQYLGRADGYRQIYELNRSILKDPDLLPIGAVLRIPASTDSAVSSSGITRWEGEPSSMGMVPVPPRPYSP